MSDHYAVEQSLQDQDQDYIFQNRQFTYINDSNSGSYQNQIVIDAGSIANSSKYFNAQESFITVPLVMTLVATAGKLGVTTNENAFAASLKNSFTNLISSLSVEITNNSVVSTTNFTNLALNFNLLTSMSLDDQLNLGPTINFAKDDALGVSYNAAANAQGLGECNNTIAPSTFLEDHRPSTFNSQSSYGKPLSRVEAREAAPFGAYGSADGAAAASTGFLWIIMETVTL